MPIEIRELIIRTAVENTREQRGQSQTLATTGTTLAGIEELLALVEKKNER